jgi:hypothetical protein
MRLADRSPIARRTSSPAGSSLTGAVSNKVSSNPARTPRAAAHFLSMISRGVFTSPNPTNPTVMFFMVIMLES